jgi:Uncharacterized conserved protein (DUF2285)
MSTMASSDPALTEYDVEHLITYLRLLDARHDGADWREVSRILLQQPDRARRVFDSHLARAKWMSGVGYRHLLRYDRRRMMIPVTRQTESLTGHDVGLFAAHRTDHRPRLPARPPQ